LNAFQKAFDLSNEHFFFEKGLANALFQAGRFDDAVLHFRSVLQKQKYHAADSANEFLPRDSNALALIGWCNYRLRRFDEAIRLFQTALTGASTEYWPLWFDLALVLLASGRQELGLKGYERAFQIADHEELDRRRGLYHVALFDLIDAKRHEFIGRESDPALAAGRPPIRRDRRRFDDDKVAAAQTMVVIKAGSSHLSGPEQA